METLEQGKTSGTLLQLILEKIRKTGPITFRDFMELALYHTEYGYYTSKEQKIGRGGDFYTSAHVSHLFGHTLGHQIAEMGDLLGWDELVIIEYGAGEGYLAKDILDILQQLAPKEGEALSYFICERSQYHREQQQKRLQDHLSQVCWVDDLDEINSGEPFKAIIFSNELIDAFPVHRVKLIDDELQEVFITEQDGSLAEITGPLSTSQLGDYFPSLNFQLQPGQEAEINLEALMWLENLGHYLNEGFVLTIDYGYEIMELANPRRFDGTVMCYRHHQADPNPLVNVGEKDITSHVNFTALMKYGKKYGLEALGFTNQMKFLIGLGIGQELENPQLNDEERQKLNMAFRELVMPDRMGERFQVLIQGKGLSGNVQLSGLKGFN